MLPYLEQDNAAKLYVNWGGNGTTGPRYDGPPNTNVTTNRYAVLTCPVDNKNSPNANVTSNNYAVNLGNTGFPQADTYNGVPNGGAPFKCANIKFGTTCSMKLSTITDGTSNTVAIAEVIQGIGKDLRGFTFWGDAAGITGYLPPNSSAPDVIYDVVYCNNLPERGLPCVAPDTAANPVMFGSRSQHPGGVNIVLCDGAVRFVSNNIALATWRALCSAQGGETVDDF